MRHETSLEKLHNETLCGIFHRTLINTGFCTLESPSQSIQINQDHIGLGIPYGHQDEFDCELTEIKIPFAYKEVREANIKRVQILQGADHPYFEYRILYEQDIEETKTIDRTWLGVNLDVSNLATCVDHGEWSFLVDEQRLKSQNQLSPADE